MTRLLLKLPWYLSATSIAALALLLAFGANWLLGDYFERSFLDEASPLASAGAPPPEATASPTTEAPTTQVTPDDALPAGATTTPPPAPSQAGVLFRGEVQDGDPGHNGEGAALILRDESGALFLRFEDFSVTNGPDLFVMLSPDADGYTENSLNLGGLKATDGNINYEIPAGTDLSQFKSVVIWCRSFNVDFAFATLEMA